MTPEWVPSPFQREDVEFFARQEYGALFYEMGLGKTSTVLAIFAELKRRGFVEKLLVITNQKIAAVTWPAEIVKWRQFRHFTYKLLHGDFKQDRARADVDIYLCPFESLAWLPAIRSQFDMIVVDESSKIKNRAAFRTKAAMYLGKRAKRRYILSGTPAGESIADLYTQIKFLDHGASLGSSWGAFFGRFMYKEGPYKEVPLQGAKERVAALISPFTRERTLKGESIAMPPITHDKLTAVLPEAAMARYRELESTMLLRLENEDVISANAAVLTNHCRQVANGAIYDSEHNWEEVHPAKILGLKTLAEKGVPLVVCYEYQHDKARILAEFGPCPVIGGGTTPTDVARIVEEWNAGRHRMILLHPKSAAHGLNLQGVAANVVFFSNPWSLEETVQLVARVWRRGQLFPVRVTRIVAEDTIDEVIADRVGAKAASQEELMALLRAYARRRIE